jgi:DNA ligase 1
VTEKLPRDRRGGRRTLPDGCVLDGEMLAWRDGRPLPFARLQQRIGRKNLTGKVLARSRPSSWPTTCWSRRRDLRGEPSPNGAAAPEEVLSAAHGPALLLSPPSPRPDWEALAALRRRRGARGKVEG